MKKDLKEDNQREVLIAAKLEKLPKSIKPDVPFTGEAIVRVQKVNGLDYLALGKWNVGAGRIFVTRDFTKGHIAKVIEVYLIDKKSQIGGDEPDEKDIQLKEALAEIEKLKADKKDEKKEQKKEDKKEDKK